MNLNSNTPCLFLLYYYNLSLNVFFFKAFDKYLQTDLQIIYKGACFITYTLNNTGKHSTRQKKFYFDLYFFWGFPGSSAGKESTCNSGDPGSIPGLGRSPWKRERLPTPVFLGFPLGSAGKESACNAGDLGSIPELGRSPGEGKGYPHQYSGLEKSMDCIVHGVAKSWTRLSDFHIYF